MLLLFFWGGGGGALSSVDTHTHTPIPCILGPCQVILRLEMKVVVATKHLDRNKNNKRLGRAGGGGVFRRRFGAHGFWRAPEKRFRRFGTQVVYRGMGPLKSAGIGCTSTKSSWPFQQAEGCLPKGAFRKPSVFVRPRAFCFCWGHEGQMEGVLISPK